MSAPTSPRAAVPPLVEGERLSRAEFERRYAACPELKKAELIAGVVHMPSPVRITRHGSPHADLVTWLGVYRAGTPGVRLGDNATVRLDEANEPQPDALLMVERGGRARIDADDYVAGAPELVAEVAAASLALDRTAKRRVYRDAGVREYLLWRVEDGGLDWWALRQGDYQPLSADPDGVLRSEAFPGLWLDVNALHRQDLAQVLAVLQQGLNSADHAAFVSRLRQQAT